MNHTESILKWAVILVVGVLAFRWFAGLLDNVLGDAGSYPSPYGLPYNPGGYIAPSPWSVTVWREPTVGRGSRFARGGGAR